MAVDSTASTWSQRFEQGLHPAIERFNASIGFDIALLQEDLDGSIAHARMLGRCGVISEPEAERLIEGLEAIRAEAAAGQFTPGLEAEDVHFAVERRLIERLGPLGKKLHTGRSRNDQVGTDLRLWLRRRIDDIDISLLRFERALLDQAERHAEVLIPGYTHLQRAQPICLAHHLLAYIEMAERDRQRFADVRRRVNLCPLGAAALAGTPVPIDRRRTAAELGFDAPYANSLDAVSDRDFTVEFMAAASLVIAPHGAGMANLLAAQSGTTVLELVNPAYQPHYFQSLMQHRGLQHRRLNAAATPLPLQEWLYEGPLMCPIDLRPGASEAAEALAALLP